MTRHIRENFHKNLGLLREFKDTEKEKELLSKASKKGITKILPRLLRGPLGVIGSAAKEILSPTPVGKGDLPKKGTPEYKEMMRDLEKQQREIESRKAPAENPVIKPPEVVPKKPETKPKAPVEVPKTRPTPIEKPELKPAPAPKPETKTTPKPKIELEPAPKPMPEPKPETKKDGKQDGKTKEEEKPKDKRSFCERNPKICTALGLAGAAAIAPGRLKPDEFSLKPTVSAPQAITGTRATQAQELQAARRQAQAWNVKEQFLDKLCEMRDEEEEEGTSPVKPRRTKASKFKSERESSNNVSSSTSSQVTGSSANFARDIQTARLQARAWNESSNFDIIRKLASEKKAVDTIVIGENTITINSRIAKKIMGIYESLNADNRQKVKNILNEDVTEVRKLINFSIKA